MIDMGCEKCKDKCGYSYCGCPCCNPCPSLQTLDGKKLDTTQRREYEEGCLQIKAQTMLGIEGYKILADRISREAVARAEKVQSSLTRKEISREVYEKHGHRNSALCPEDECIVCAMIDCPHGEPFHYHHDGCPACHSDLDFIERIADCLSSHCVDYEFAVEKARCENKAGDGRIKRLKFIHDDFARKILREIQPLIKHKNAICELCKKECDTSIDGHANLYCGSCFAKESFDPKAYFSKETMDLVGKIKERDPRPPTFEYGWRNGNLVIEEKELTMEQVLFLGSLTTAALSEMAERTRMGSGDDSLHVERALEQFKGDKNYLLLVRIVYLLLTRHGYLGQITHINNYPKGFEDGKVYADNETSTACKLIKERIAEDKEKEYAKGYEQALIDNHILHGEDLKRFVEDMGKPNPARDKMLDSIKGMKINTTSSIPPEISGCYCEVCLTHLTQVKQKNDSLNSSKEQKNKNIRDRLLKLPDEPERCDCRDCNGTFKPTKSCDCDWDYTNPLCPNHEPEKPHLPSLPLCQCGHRATQHSLVEGDCRSEDCECNQYREVQ